MLKIVFILYIVFFAGLSVASESPNFYVKHYIFYDSEPVPFKDFEEDWDSTYRQGNRFLSYEWREIGVDLGRWGFGAVYRNDVNMKFKPDTALALYTLVNELPLLNSAYDVDVEARNYKATGFRLFYDIIDKPNIQWDVGVTSLYGIKIFDGSLKGRLSSISDSDYNYDNIVLDYYYSQDELFDHQVAKPNGYGHSFDTSLYWEPNPGFKIHLKAKDIFGRIYWKDTPLTVATIESDNKTYNEDNYVKVSPLLSGRQSTRDYTQFLPLYLFMKSEIHFNGKYFSSIELEHFAIKTYARFSFGTKLPKNTSGELVLDPDNQVLGVRFDHDMFNIALMTDHYDLNKAHYLTMMFDFKYQY